MLFKHCFRTILTTCVSDTLTLKICIIDKKYTKFVHFFKELIIYPILNYEYQ